MGHHVLVNGIFAQWQTFELHVINQFFLLFSFEIEAEKKQAIIVHDQRIVLFFIQMPVDFDNI